MSQLNIASVYILVLLFFLSQVSMHGRPRQVTWTRLTSSAMAGSTAITVETTSTGWSAGDQIVIAPSGWGVTEGEIRTISAISGKGE